MVILRALSQELVILKSTLTVYKVFRAIALCANFPTYPDHPHYVFSFLLPKPTCKRDCYILSAPSRFTRTSEPDRALAAVSEARRGKRPTRLILFPPSANQRQTAIICDFVLCCQFLIEWNEKAFVIHNLVLSVYSCDVRFWKWPGKGLFRKQNPKNINLHFYIASLQVYSIHYGFDL